MDIPERPDIVETEKRIGDWEADTITGGSHSGAIVSLVDRATKYTLLGRVDKKIADAVGSTTIQPLGSGKIPVHTITTDHIRVAKALDAQFFFTRLYHLWERVLNEHSNGLVREYFPKGTDFHKVSDEDVKKV